MSFRTRNLRSDDETTSASEGSTNSESEELRPWDYSQKRANERRSRKIQRIVNERRKAQAHEIVNSRNPRISVWRRAETAKALEGSQPIPSTPGHAAGFRTNRHHSPSQGRQTSPTRRPLTFATSKTLVDKNTKLQLSKSTPNPARNRPSSQPSSPKNLVESKRPSSPAIPQRRAASPSLHRRSPSPKAPLQPVENTEDVKKERHFKALETRYKIQNSRFLRQLSDLKDISERYLKNRHVLITLKDQMIEQLGIDPGEIPSFSIEGTEKEKEESRYLEENVEAKARNAALEEKCRSLDAELKAALERSNRQAQKMEEVKKQVVELEEDVRGVVQEMQKTENRQDDLEERVEKSQKLSDQLNDTILKLLDQADKQESANTTMGKIIEQLQSDKGILFSEKTKVEELLKDMNNRYEEEQIARIEAERALDKIHAEKTLLENRFIEMKNTLESAVIDYAESRKESSCVREVQLKEEVETAKAKLRRAQEAIESIKSSQTDLVQKLEEQERELSTKNPDLLVIDLTAKDGHMKSMETRISQLEASLKREFEEKEKLKEVIRQTGPQGDRCKDEKVKKMEAEMKQLSEMIDEERQWSRKAIEEAEIRCKKAEELVAEKQRELILIKATLPSDQETSGGSEENHSIPPDFADIYRRLSEKNETLFRLERRLEDLESSHFKCAKIRSIFEARVASLEADLSLVPF